MTKKQQHFSDMRRTIERVCDADLATVGNTDVLRERISIEVIIGAAEVLQSKRRVGWASKVTP